MLFHPNGMEKGFGTIIYFGTISQTLSLYLSHTDGIEKGFRTTIHIGNIRQTAYITDITPSKVNFMESDLQNIFILW